RAVRRGPDRLRRRAAPRAPHLGSRQGHPCRGAATWCVHRPRHHAHLGGIVPARLSNLPRPQQVLLDARGRTLIERRGVRKSSLATDAYHFLRTASWLRIALLCAALFAAVNLLFAAILHFGNARVMNADGFLDDL